MLKLLFWLGILLTGIFLGVFMKPRTIAITGAALMVADVVGMVLSGLLSNNKPTDLTWAFGIAMILIPVIFVVVYIGATFGEKIKNKRL
jgi:hypothetical protein